MFTSVPSESAWSRSCRCNMSYVLINRRVGSVIELAGGRRDRAIGLTLLTGYTGQPSLGHARRSSAWARSSRLLRAAEDADGNSGTHSTSSCTCSLALVAGGLGRLIIASPRAAVAGQHLVIVHRSDSCSSPYVWQKWTTFTGGHTKAARCR